MTVTMQKKDILQVIKIFMRICKIVETSVTLDIQTNSLVNHLDYEIDSELEMLQYYVGALIA
jgi:hypothetical protein